MTSPELNRDTEIFGTEVGVADAMRFQVSYRDILLQTGLQLLPDHARNRLRSTPAVGVGV